MITAIVTRIRAAPLPPADSGELVRRFLSEAAGAREADEDLVTRLQQRAEGNPFFTAELVRSLVDRETEANELPPTLESVLIARIDRLPLAAKQVLHLAAVAGRIFSHRLLLDIVSGEDLRSEDGSLDEALLRLVREQLVREYSGASGPTVDQPPDRMFVFEHQLTLEAAYGSLLRRKRRALHRRVAEAWSGSTLNRSRRS